MSSSTFNSTESPRAPELNLPETSRFQSQAPSAEDLLKSQTVGLVALSDFRKRRAEALEQKELGRFTAATSEGGIATPGGKSDGVLTPSELPKKKKRKPVAKGKLSFGLGDGEEEYYGGESPAISTAVTPRSTTPAPRLSRVGSPVALAQDDSTAERKRLGPNADLNIAPKAMTKATLQREVQTREKLRRDFLSMQEAVKATEIIIPFVFYDGTNLPGGKCKVKKGDHIWVFLDRSRKVGAELGVGGGEKASNRREWARVGVDDLMLVRGEVIIPHHYEFYYFIVNRTIGPSSIPLFNYSSSIVPTSRSASSSPEPQEPYNPLQPAPIASRRANTGIPTADDLLSLEGTNDDPNFTKVVDRRWYERNKHIFPASVWEEFDPGRDYSKGRRRDAEAEEVMDFALRCNSLKCRLKLDERAVVTTCSHIFCLQCSESLGLTAPAGGNRLCPACQTQLPNPDDVVSTQLNPTEDYKTSVLSGLNPTIIIECAGRGLSFWTYQSTQEIIYQEYLAKSLTDKYGNLSTQLDKIINDANSEIDSLNQKLTTMQVDQDRLRNENTNLVAAFREKSRKHQQTQELYDRLKRKEMTAATQSAAYQSVDEVLGSVGNRVGSEHPVGMSQYPNTGRAPGQGQPFLYHDNGDNAEQGYNRGHSNSNGSNENGKGGMMPPPPRRPQGFGAPGLGASQEMATPSQHRTRLGPLGQSSNRASQTDYRSSNMISNSMQNQTPSQRQPFGIISGNSVNRPSVGGYGMSAGLKVGRQQGNAPRPGVVGQNGPTNRFIHPLAQSQSQS